jgi:hypothetical protein
MQPTKSFLSALAIVGLLGVVAISLGSARSAAAAEADAYPLSTKLTAEMQDYFALRIAYQRPDLDALLQCSRTPACSRSDTASLRFVTAGGAVVPTYDSAPSTVIEHLRRVRNAPSRGVTESRTEIRRFVRDREGRMVMNGSDSVVTVTVSLTGTDTATAVRVHRYTHVSYLVTDPTFKWPITGLVVLDQSEKGAPTPLTTYATVSFDGTPYATVLTTHSLMHRVNLQTEQLETAIPDR